MSVCIAWIKGDKSYLIADTLVSSTKDITQSSTTPFLQRKEHHNGYYVEEEGLKIYEISNNFAIAVAGEIRSYSEILHWIYALNESISLPELKELLLQNFSHLLNEIEILFLYRDTNKNRILVWDGQHFYEPAAASTPVFIGCGAKDIKFKKSVTDAISSNNDHDSHQYLVQIISYVQCLSIKLKTIRSGFGGTFYGLFISSKLHWMRDLEYVLLARNGSVSQSISVIIRKSSIVISSSIENSMRILLNIYTSTEWYAEYHNMKSVLRAVDTKEAFYYIYYGLKSNRIYLWEAKGILIRDDFRKWIRRGNKKVDYLFAIDPAISDLITSGTNKSIEPQGYILSTPGRTYLPFDKISTDVVKQLHNVKLLVGFDFDFVALDCSSFNKEHIKAIRKNIEYFYNIVVIDYDFFCQKILNSLLDFYNKEDFDLNEMHLDLLLRHCLQNDYHVEFSKIKIIVVKKANDYIIEGINITSWFKKYYNCSFIITEDIEHDLAQLLIYWIKEYYINERYFHLGMNVLIADNQVLGEILELLIPLERRDNESADWILVRLNNYETSMPGGFNYVNEEWAFLDLLNVNIDYKLQQKIAITEKEQELISGTGEDVIHDWYDNNSLFTHVQLIDPTK